MANFKATLSTLCLVPKTQNEISWVLAKEPFLRAAVDSRNVYFFEDSYVRLYNLLPPFTAISFGSFQLSSQP